MEKLSIVVPCFNEQETIPLFYPAVQKVLAKMPQSDARILVCR